MRSAAKIFQSWCLDPYCQVFDQPFRLGLHQDDLPVLSRPLTSASPCDYSWLSFNNFLGAETLISRTRSMLTRIPSQVLPFRIATDSQGFLRPLATSVFSRRPSVPADLAAPTLLVHRVPHRPHCVELVKGSCEPLKYLSALEDQELPDPIPVSRGFAQNQPRLRRIGCVCHLLVRRSHRSTTRPEYTHPESTRKVFFLRPGRLYDSVGNYLR